MEELEKLLKEHLNKDFISAVLSNPRDKDGMTKVRIRPLLCRGKLVFQLESFCNRQAFHENLEADAACRKILEDMNLFRQLQMETKTLTCTVLVSKKGKVTIKKKINKKEKEQAEFLHNRKKQYILEEGTAVPFLQDLGVMTQDGKIVHSRFDKFRQINRFLEFIQDILPKLPADREITVLDFGCGKSYLTFAMYYYLHELKGYDVRMIGLDLKKEVIEHCNSLAEKYGCEKLCFLEGNIADYTGTDEVDLVVTLHACDTATDFALAKAVGWKAKVILSVPCCQHELNGQLEENRNKDTAASTVLVPLLTYGLIRERMAALLTDGLRAQYLEREGYDVQVLEFIDMEHTPKNILIRAVRRKQGQKPGGKTKDSIRACEQFFGITPSMGGLLDGCGDKE